MSQFHYRNSRLWFKALRRRSQKAAKRMNWELFYRLEREWLPRLRVVHPWPSVRFAATTQGRSRVRFSHARICAGEPCKGYPYRAYWFVRPVDQRCNPV